MKQRVIWFWALMASLLLAAPAFGAPMQWTNGHWYDVIDFDGGTWTEALNAAASSTYNGLAGHLATVTSQGEHDFIYQMSSFQSQKHIYTNVIWIGGYQTHKDQEPDGG